LFIEQNLHNVTDCPISSISFRDSRFKMGDVISKVNEGTYQIVEELKNVQ
jgi:hypothetical protein